MDRNTRIAFTLIFVLMISYFFAMSKFSPPQEASAPAEMVGGDAVEQVDGYRPASQDQTSPPSREWDSTPSEAAGSREQQQFDIPDTPRRLIVVETELLRYTLDSEGATISEIELLKFEGLNSEFVKIFGPGENGQAVKALTIEVQSDTGPLNSKDWNFRVEGDGGRDLIHLSPEDELQLVFSARNEGGGALVKTYTFRGDSYEFLLGVNADLVGGLGGARSIGVDWSAGILPAEKNHQDELRSFNNFSRVGESQKKKSLRNFKGSMGLKERGEWSDEGTVQWAATRSKYFVAALIPVETMSGRVALLGDNEEQYLGWFVEFPLRGGRSSFSEQFMVYVGPLDHKVLAEYDRGLDKLVDLGKLIRPISIALRWLMDFLHRFIPNYGVIIILMSVITKILFYRLSNKSFKSMKEMQAIQPELKALKDKYPNDNQRVQKETMALYKEHGVNPLGGCLPLLFQMPVFFALYRVLRSAVELRGAGFVGWINDLSNMDVIYRLPFEIPMLGGFIDNSISVLPVLMGLSMWVQQKFGGTGMGMDTGASQTQNQMAMMNKIMPFFMTFIFYRMPSGLVLYWLVNNILTAVQQYYIHKGLDNKPKVITAS